MTVRAFLQEQEDSIENTFWKQAVDFADHNILVSGTLGATAGGAIAGIPGGVIGAILGVVNGVPGYSSVPREDSFREGYDSFEEVIAKNSIEFLKIQMQHWATCFCTAVSFSFYPYYCRNVSLSLNPFPAPSPLPPPQTFFMKRLKDIFERKSIRSHHIHNFFLFVYGLSLISFFPEILPESDLQFLKNVSVLPELAFPIVQEARKGMEETGIFDRVVNTKVREEIEKLKQIIFVPFHHIFGNIGQK